MKITKQLRTETGHRLVNYDGRCAHLHGHSYLWEVTAQSSTGLDDKNMVMDFKDLKKAMHAALDPLDHALLLAPTDPLWALAEAYVPIHRQAHALEGGLQILDVLLRATNGDAPRLIKWHDNPTAESMALWALKEIQIALCDAYAPADSLRRKLMPYFISRVRVWETATSFAEATSGDLA